MRTLIKRIMLRIEEWYVDKFIQKKPVFVIRAEREYEELKKSGILDKHKK